MFFKILLFLATPFLSSLVLADASLVGNWVENEHSCQAESSKPMAPFNFLGYHGSDVTRAFTFTEDMKFEYSVRFGNTCYFKMVEEYEMIKEKLFMHLSESRVMLSDPRCEANKHKVGNPIITDFVLDKSLKALKFHWPHGGFCGPGYNSVSTLKLED